jgi:hypothetical protein
MPLPGAHFTNGHSLARQEAVKAREGQMNLGHRQWCVVDDQKTGDRVHAHEFSGPSRKYVISEEEPDLQARRLPVPSRSRVLRTGKNVRMGNGKSYTVDTHRRHAARGELGSQRPVGASGLLRWPHRRQSCYPGTSGPV